MAPIFQRMIQAQREFQDELLKKQNVNGVAVGYKESGGVITDEPAVVVLVQTKHPITALSADDLIPKEINGIRTDVYEVGYLVAQQDSQDRHRPIIPCGVSIGHYKVTAGTLGAMVVDRTTGERFILSNNHVLANSNEASQGDAITQPGKLDGGQNPTDMVARLERFIPLNYLDGDIDPPAPKDEPVDTTQPPDGCLAFLTGVSRLLGSTPRATTQAVTTASSATDISSIPGVVSVQSVDNIADCALARPMRDDMFSGEIRKIGIVKGTAEPMLGMRVCKSGRTTDYTEGTITLLNATVDVGYTTSQGTRTARFTGQVITEAMSQGGDSGSLMVDAASNTAVGLLFAGSGLATIFTPIDVVLNALNVTLK